jgi:hypothetical protein
MDIPLLPLWTFVVNFIMFWLDGIDCIVSSGVSMGEK